MIAYSKAFPHAVYFGRANPFPSHFLITSDEARTLLKARGWNPRTGIIPPRAATPEELADPTVRTYQLIINGEATPKDFIGIGCRFLLGRTYCFGETVEAPKDEASIIEAVTAVPWQKSGHTETLAVAKETHRVHSEVLLDGAIRFHTDSFTSLEDATAFAVVKESYIDPYCWTEPTKQEGFDWMPVSELYWAEYPDHVHPARVRITPIRS